MSYAYARASQAYSQVAVQSSVASATPHRLIGLLYDGALQRIAQARGHLLRNEVAAKGEMIGKAMAIVDGLRGSLDRSVQHELTENLDNLYDYMIRQLLQANLKNDVSYLDEVAILLRDLQSAWASIPLSLQQAADLQLAVASGA